METGQGVGTGAPTGQGVGTGTGHRGITCVLQTQFCLTEKGFKIVKQLLQRSDAESLVIILSHHNMKSIFPMPCFIFCCILQQPLSLLLIK